MTNSPGHLWRDKWTALSGPLSTEAGKDEEKHKSWKKTKKSMRFVLEEVSYAPAEAYLRGCAGLPRLRTVQGYLAHKKPPIYRRTVQPHCTDALYRVTSHIRNRPPLSPYSRDMPRPLW